jgi:hypothetical protein
MTESFLNQVVAGWQSLGGSVESLRAVRMDGTNGSGGSSQGQGSGSPQAGAQQQQSGGDSGGQQQQQQQGESDYSLASQFLDRVDPAHRAVVEPYVKQWDAGVTRRFQELHSQYQPYAQLGDIESLQQAVGIAQMLDENPWQIYGILHESLMGQQPPQDFGQQQGFQQQQFPQQQFPPTGQMNGQQYGQQYGGQQQSNPFGQQQQGLSDQGQIPEAVQQELGQLKQIVTTLAQHVIQGTQEKTQAEEDAELDQFVQGLHDEFGDFDERFVLGQIVSGMNPDDAIKSWNDTISTHVQTHVQKNNGVPHILGGGGVPTGQQLTPKDLDRKQTQSLVADALARAAQARQG